MAIFDIFEEVTEKKTQKTDTGDNRIFGVMVGEVTDNWSQKFPGRVCVSIHTRDKEANVLKWARVAMPSGGTEYGMYFLPEVGDQVLVAFEQGLIDKPYVIGCLQKNANKFLTKSKHQKNQHKRIVTRHGSSIEFEDVSGQAPGDSGDGTKDKISIFTPEKAHEITLDNEKKKITITDKDKNARLEMESGKGKILMTTMKSMTFKVGDNISVVMNGQNGKITINARDIVINTTGKMNVSSGGMVKIEGSSIQESSNGLLKLSANGMVSVSGRPIKLG